MFFVFKRTCVTKELHVESRCGKKTWRRTHEASGKKSLTELTRGLDNEIRDGRAQKQQDVFAGGTKEDMRDSHRTSASKKATDADDAEDAALTQDPWADWASFDGFVYSFHSPRKQRHIRDSTWAKGSISGSGMEWFLQEHSTVARWVFVRRNDLVCEGQMAEQLNVGSGDWRRSGVHGNALWQR